MGGIVAVLRHGSHAQPRLSANLWLSNLGMSAP